ncbi:hypothetical protein Vadar_020211 [Vaccinium darrowii]|uniref:Uncharacterized protein n=1 Tax=Vaccinium darrowii TaxID=229202 RepID=A0ACB7Y0D9_9ERIC|nr:hypothetical protein Vadar_020211 [Vaccinium darrowii]
MLKQTPFWLLIQAIRNGTLDPEKCPVRTDEVVAKLIATYNPSNNNLRLGRKDVNLTTTEVKLVFGLTGGTRPFEVKMKKRNEVLFAKRNNISKGRLTSKAIGEMLQSYVQQDEAVKIEDTVRLVCMYLIVKLFFPTSGISISWKHVHVLENINQIKTYDWASEIRNELMNSIKKNQHSPKEVKGCILLLPYWLCEHINLNEDDEPEHAIPRLLKWNIPSLESSLKKTADLKKATHINVKTDELHETDKEAEIYKIDLPDVAQVSEETEEQEKGEEEEEDHPGLDDISQYEGTEGGQGGESEEEEEEEEEEVEDEDEEEEEDGDGEEEKEQEEEEQQDEEEQEERKQEQQGEEQELPKTPQDLQPEKESEHDIFTPSAFFSEPIGNDTFLSVSPSCNTDTVSRSTLAPNTYPQSTENLPSPLPGYIGIVKQRQDGGFENLETVSAAAVDTSTKPVIEKLLKDRDVMIARTKELMNELIVGKEKTGDAQRNLIENKKIAETRENEMQIEKQKLEDENIKLNEMNKVLLQDKQAANARENELQSQNKQLQDEKMQLIERNKELLDNIEVGKARETELLSRNKQLQDQNVCLTEESNELIKLKEAAKTRQHQLEKLQQQLKAEWEQKIEKLQQEKQDWEKKNSELQDKVTFKQKPTPSSKVARIKDKTTTGARKPNIDPIYTYPLAEKKDVGKAKMEVEATEQEEPKKLKAFTKDDMHTMNLVTPNTRKKLRQLWKYSTVDEVVYTAKRGCFVLAKHIQDILLENAMECQIMDSYTELLVEEQDKLPTFDLIAS